MATIKAGTYRFNDVLTKSTNYTVEGAILFNSSVNGETATCNGIYERSLDDWLTLAYSVYITELGDYMGANVYNDGWYTDDFGDGIKTITIPTDQEVSDEFYAWFTANAAEVVEDTEETPVATIIYGGSVIASLNEGQTATLKCAGMKMESDVVVEVAEQTESTPPNIQPLTITENGTYTAEDGVDGYSPITVEVESGGGVNFPIGDGNTHIWITLGEGRTNPYLRVGINGTVTVDWGDGGEADVLTDTNSATWKGIYHNYTSAGDYVISLYVDGEIELKGDNNNSDGGHLLAFGGGNYYQNYAYKNAVRKVEIGSTTKLGNCAFRGYYGLEAVSISNGVTSIGQSAFSSCYSLKSISIPESVTSIAGYAFQNCYSLTSVIFPSGVTSLDGWTFSSCYSVAFYDFTKHTIIPTLTSTAVFSNIQSDCKFLVPAALYDEWIAATNWSTHASKIVTV